MGTDRRIWILGLMQSGTTVFWKAWRRNSSFFCLDEPFSTPLGLPVNNDKDSFQKLISIFNKSPANFWRLYAPMDALQELDERFTQEQKRYLLFLLSQSPHLVIDETHLHLHVAELSELTPDAYLIHLVRRARGFVTSHLRPSAAPAPSLTRHLVYRLRHYYNGWSFWKRTDYLTGLRRNEVIGSHPKSKFGLLLAAEGYDAERIMASPTVVRLLAYWHFHYHWLKCNGPRFFGARFKEIRYEDFATAPSSVMAELYEWIGVPCPPHMNYDFVHGPKPPFQSRDSRWIQYARVAGFKSDEIETLL